MKPRSKRLRAAADRYGSGWATPSEQLAPADLAFRVRYAFEQGADWERRQWMSRPKGSPYAYNCRLCGRGFHVPRSLAMHQRIIHRL